MFDKNLASPRKESTVLFDNDSMINDKVCTGRDLQSFQAECFQDSKFGDLPHSKL